MDNPRGRGFRALPRDLRCERCVDPSWRLDCLLSYKVDVTNQSGCQGGGRLLTIFP